MLTNYLTPTTKATVTNNPTTARIQLRPIVYTTDQKPTWQWQLRRNH